MSFLGGGLVALAIFALWFISGLVRDNRQLNREHKEDLERQIEIESGVVKTNAKADNMLDNPEYKRRMFDEDNS